MSDATSSIYTEAHIAYLKELHAQGVELTWEGKQVIGHRGGYVESNFETRAWPEPLPPKLRRCVRAFSGTQQAIEAWLNPMPWHRPEGYARCGTRFEGNTFYKWAGAAVATKDVTQKLVLVECYHWRPGVKWQSYMNGGWSRGGWSYTHHSQWSVRNVAKKLGWTVLQVPRVGDHTYCVQSWLSAVTMYLTRAQRARKYGKQYRASAIQHWNELCAYCERFRVPMPPVEPWMRSALVEARLVGQ